MNDIIELAFFKQEFSPERRYFVGIRLQKQNFHIFTNSIGKENVNIFGNFFDMFSSRFLVELLW